MRITFHVDLPESDIDDLRVGRAGVVDAEGRLLGSSHLGYQGRMHRRLFPILACLTAFVEIDLWQLQREKFAPLYQSGVYYQADPPGHEDWVDVGHLYARGWGDCKSLASLRCAELRLRGVAAVPCISWKHFEVGAGKRLTLVHVQVLHPDDSIECPSRELGMKGEYNDDV